MKYKTGFSILALAAMTAQASAATLCDTGSAAALKTAAVQQELMVAGFTCGATSAYNRFVLADQPELQKSDAALMAYFRNRDGNEAGYDSYKTKIANLAAARSAADGSRYCAATTRTFAAAEGRSLKDFIAGEHLLIAAPESCAIRYDDTDVAVAGVPSYALPAAPYGAPPPPAPRTTARAADPDRRQAYADQATNNPYDNDVPPPPPPRYERADQNWGQNWSYGPYGWLPPRPPRRWTWYQGPYDD